MRNFARFISACIILGAIGFGGFKVWQNIYPNVTGSDKANSVSAQNYTVNSQGLAAVQNTITEHPEMDMSVSLVDLQTEKAYDYGDNTSFTAASIGKLVTATAFINRVEKGTASLDDVIDGDTAQSNIQKMLVKSDNEAWAAMKQTVTLEAQQSYAQSLGLTSYDAANNTVSSHDVALLLSKLASGKLCDNDHANLLLSYMKDANYRAYIVAAVPDGVSVYHKVGLLEDRVHDAAIIKKGNRSFVLVAFTKAKNGNYDFSQGPPIFNSITNASLQTFF